MSTSLYDSVLMKSLFCLEQSEYLSNSMLMESIKDNVHLDSELHKNKDNFNALAA